MSYDIELQDPVTKATLQLQAPHHMRGGTYAIGGTADASLNVTYNYATHFRRLGERGIRTLYGMSGADSAALLEKPSASLATTWAPTTGSQPKGMRSAP